MSPSADLELYKKYEAVNEKYLQLENEGAKNKWSNPPHLVSEEDGMDTTYSTSWENINERGTGWPAKNNDW